MIGSFTRLQRDFFERPTLQVAQELLGKEIVFEPHRGIITETEAYIGTEDPACHAARGRTNRTAIMFGPAGFLYVYLIYGMYYCLNFVTEVEGFPAAVLIRGVKMISAPYTHLNGPGKVCREFGINKTHNGIDLVTSRNFYLVDAPLLPSFCTTPRIGIRVGTDKLWRFVADEEVYTQTP